MLLKSFRPTEEDRNSLEPLDYHRRFGPPCVAPRIERTFVVPIRPEYHSLLFPEAEPQLGLGLDDADRPYGNALRKAYLCHAPIRALPEGSTLLFYRSLDAHAITCIGVLEEARRLDDAEAIGRLVARRTVYSYDQIVELAKEPTLVLLFRQDRMLIDPIGLAEAKAAQLLSGAPQSIAAVRPEGIEWLIRRIGA